jgi:hypothetical protein
LGTVIAASCTFDWFGIDSSFTAFTAGKAILASSASSEAAAASRSLPCLE